MGPLRSAGAALLLSLVMAAFAGQAAAQTVDSVKPVLAPVTDSIEPEQTEPETAETISPKVSLDTLYYIPRGGKSAGSLVTNPIDFEDHLTQRPTTALFKSMVLPGWGQIGNRSYFKAAIVIGLEGWFFSKALHFRKTTSDRYDLYAATPDSLSAQRDRYYDAYQDQRALRNQYSWFAALTIFISMFDAYVDAHLSGAPDKVNFSRVGFDLRPDRSGGLKASLSMSF